ncbi:DNA gyrase/topoisomerase IV subunit A [Humidisolicoccus flavus]|uniref:DNA gyrase/topoisomerase IV subunit A n=1 Tax=Humidisolicoccus flavus TaxID=3111414 RepID=UPI0032442E72
MAAADLEPSGERIDDVDVADEMQGSFLEYAYSVIYSRALPDARDGLKPVQRRILFQMAEMGLRPDRGHVKSARVVGEVMGKLHPHGDSPIYEALVRLAQDFTLRLPLVDGHGNFGSLDDGPAAARYTEARLDAAALSLTDGLDEDVVDFVPNYDNQIMQPSVLPAAYPNLLVNGGSGIAVGMATNMAPHNLVEVVGAARHLLANPKATLEELMAFVPAPDLPNGAIIAGLDGVREAYATGRGSFRVRAKASIERSGRTTSIVITELPFLVGPERVIEKIRDAVNAKKLLGLADVHDLTDRKNGLRLVIKLKSGFQPEAVLEHLYRFTPLEEGFSINNVALVGGVPKTLGLVELLRVYLDHRIAVVRRRTEYRLRRKQERLHLVEGLLIAIVDIDEVIQVIRSSDDSEEARTRLREIFDLSEVQAEYILELRLRRLTKFSRIELESEKDDLLSAIAELSEILASKSRLYALISEELAEVAEKFGTPRRTLLTEAAPKTSAKAGAAQLQVPDAPCVVLASTTGRVARVDVAEMSEIPVPARRSRHDALLGHLRATTRGEFGVVTSLARLIRLSPVELPSLPATSVGLSAGAKFTELVGPLERNERVIGIISLDDERPALLATAAGVVKRVRPGEWPPKPSFPIMTLKPGDRLVSVAHASDESSVVIMTSNAQLLRFDSSDIRPQGPSGGGIAGIKLAPKAEVLFATATSDDAQVVTVSTAEDTIPGAEFTRAKVSDLAEFPKKGRGTGGVRAHAFLKGESHLALAWAGISPLAVAKDGAQRVLPAGKSKRDGSGTPLEQMLGSVGAQLGSVISQNAEGDDLENDETGSAEA